MNAIHPLAETDEAVTLSRVDFDALISAVEDAEDVVALHAAGAHEEIVGKAEARAGHLPAEAVLRLVSGQHPITVWREQRGLSISALADEAGVSRSYLSEVEAGKKPGSIAAYRDIAAALGVTLDDLSP